LWHFATGAKTLNLRSVLELLRTSMDMRHRPPPPLPSRPWDFHPEPLTEPDLTLSRHPARATAQRLPPSIEHRFLPLPVDPSQMANDPLPSLHGHPASSLLRSSPPLAGASLLSASRFEPLALFPWHRRLGSHVPYKSTTGIADPQRMKRQVSFFLEPG
jgi:hypothetical protein